MASSMPRFRDAAKTGRSGRLVQRPVDFALPRQCVHQLVQLHGDLGLAQGLATIVEQAQVGDHAERVGHRDHALAQLDPVPRHTGRAFFGVVTPQRLTGAGAIVVAESQHSRAEVDKM